jgi:hypothetical protein
MRSADDVVQRSVVFAASIRGSRDKERYRCRSCREFVFYVSSGGQLPAHFSHYRFQEGDYCEERVAALEREQLSVREAVVTVLACQMYESRRGIECRFSILYRPREGINRVRVWQEKNVNVYEVHEGCDRLQLPVESKCSEYFIYEIDQSGDSEEATPVEGFSGPVVFRRADPFNLRVPHKHHLRSGEYLAVFPSVFEQFPESLFPERIASALELSAVGFTIPEKPDNYAIEFLRRVFGMEVRLAQVDYAIIKPLIVDEEASDCWTIGAEGTLGARIYVDPNFRSSPVSFLIRKWTVRGMEPAEVLELRGKSGFYDLELEISALASRLILVGLGTREHAESLFEVELRPNLVGPRSASLDFIFVRDGEKERYPWSGHQARNLLLGVSSGKTQFAGIEGSRGLQAEMVLSGQRFNLLDKVNWPVLIERLKSSEGGLIELQALGFPDLKIRNRRRLSSRATLNGGRAQGIGIQGVPSMREAFRHGAVSAYAFSSQRCL